MRTSSHIAEGKDAFYAPINEEKFFILQEIASYKMKNPTGDAHFFSFDKQ